MPATIHEIKEGNKVQFYIVEVGDIKLTEDDLVSLTKQMTDTDYSLGPGPRSFFKGEPTEYHYKADYDQFVDFVEGLDYETLIMNGFIGVFVLQGEKRVQVMSVKVYIEENDFSKPSKWVLINKEELLEFLEGHGYSVKGNKYVVDSQGEKIIQLVPLKKFFKH